MSRLGDIGLVHHFKQALNSCLRESIYRLQPMPRTWVEWKHEPPILDNQWRRFNASCPQAAMPKTPATTPMRSVAIPPPAQSSARLPPTPSTSVSKPAVRARPRPGAYETSGCLRSSDVSARGHSKGTSPCWMTEQKMLLRVRDSMYTKNFT